MEHRITKVETRVSHVEETLDKMNRATDKLESNIDRMEVLVTVVAQMVRDEQRGKNGDKESSNDNGRRDSVGGAVRSNR